MESSKYTIMENISEIIYLDYLEEKSLANGLMVLKIQQFANILFPNISLYGKEQCTWTSTLTSIFD